MWFIVTVFLRIPILLFAGYPLYQDEQERFVCNTIQPGCANVCYDLFAPISLFRFWLVQIIALCLPYVIFVVYVVHKVSIGLAVSRDSVVYHAKASIYEDEPLDVGPSAERDRCFIGAYVLQLVSRTLLEAAFGAAHYYFFGFYIPRRFLCQHAQCTTQMDCYISRPTEKTVMLNFMLGLAALSLFLNILDFISTIRCSVKKKNKCKVMLKRVSDEKQCLLSAGGPTKAKDSNIPDVQRELAVEALKIESFRKRRGSKSSVQERGDASTLGQNSPSLKGSTSPLGSAKPQGCNTNGNNGYSVSQEEPRGVNDSEVVLCPPEPLGTPRSIRVSKRSGLKPPPPPPRRDFLTSSTAPGGPTGDGSTICTRRVGQYTLVELTSSAQLRRNDDGQEKRSEWV